MKLEIDIPEHHYNNIMSIDSISLGRAPYKGIIMYAINAIKQGKVLEQEPIKNDLAHNLCDSCTNIGCEFQSGIVRTKCAFYRPSQLSSGLDKNSKKLEKDFGELDCISRKSVITIIQNHWWNCRDIDKLVNELPPVTPQEPRCKECKWWKDSDGEYRRGCGAESKCPINRKEVFEGNGYCFMFEPQESEDNNAQTM